MISAFSNTFKIPELRRRILFTLAVIVIVRLGAAITCPASTGGAPGVVPRTSAPRPGGSVAALFNIFSGGALENCAVFSLGIMPYISASIMLQLLTAVIPQLGKLAQGRWRPAEDHAVHAVCDDRAVHFPGLPARAFSFENPESNPLPAGIMDTIARLGMPLVSDPGLAFRVMTVITLTAGTMFLMWLGDQITDRGIGNGMSLIITVGIVARLPAALIQAWRTFVPSGGRSSQVNPIDPRLHGRVPRHRHRGGHLRDPGAAQDHASSTPSASSAGRCTAARRSTCR